MTDEHLAHWREQFAGLLDPQAAHSDHVLTVDRDENRPGLRRKLRAVYHQHPDVDGVLVRIDGLDVGIATRATADREAGTAGDQVPGVDLGSGDGATLLGLLGEFRAITFVCPNAGCTVSFLKSFYDEREVPSCPKHGRAVVQL